MTNAKADSAKLLFVLSNDYGELSNALYLVMGEHFATVLLMPDRLYALNKDSLPVSTRCYRAPAEVIAAVEEEKPDIVLLFSGYLYAINNIFDVEALKQLVGMLQSRSCRIVTSDPFLGLMARVDDGIFNDRHPAKPWLTSLFSQVFAILRNVLHLHLVDIGTEAKVPSVSFFNPNIVLDRSRQSERAERACRELGIESSEHIWLFVLSSEDYGHQAAVHGRGQFDELLIGRLWQAVLAGRQPVLIAPQPCIASLRDRGALPPTAVLLPFCRQDHFTSLLAAAEHAFYWNIFSNSVLIRIVNYRSVFFFAYGHMVYAINPLLDLGMKYYYANSDMPYLNSDQALVPEELSRLARRQEQTLEPARNQFRCSPTPQEMVEKILHCPRAQATT